MSAMSPALVCHTPGRGELALLNVNLTLQHSGKPYSSQENLITLRKGMHKDSEYTVVIALVL